MDPGQRPSDDEMDVIVHGLEAAGLLTIGFDAEGRETWTLTPKGAQVAAERDARARSRRREPRWRGRWRWAIIAPSTPSSMPSRRPEDDPGSM
jgi:hypothetical protein